MIKKFFYISGLIAFSSLYSQKTHTVSKGDNPYNISKKYNISLEELYQLNPKTKDGKLAIGDVLIVQNSVKNTPKNATVKAVSTAGEFGKITLQPKQTVYGITKQYQISETELRRLNPDLDSNMKIGDQVTLPLAQINKYGGNQAVAVVVEEKKPVMQTVEPIVEPIVEKALTNDSYQVQAKDNYYKLSRKFNVSQSELFAMNPGLEAKGLQPGSVIKIKSDVQNTSPQTQTSTVAQTEPVNKYTSTSVEDDFVTYTVQSGDTVFGILNKFGISLDELISLNPQLSAGLKSGQILKIKKLDAGYVKKYGDALNIVLMLPFGFDTNDSKYRTLSLDFLSGAKLAIERNAKRGQKLDVKVVDAGNAESFKNSLSQINRDNTDLIVGPFFKSSVLQVLDYVKTSKIPVVAPFANSDDLMKFDNLILIETKESVYVERIVKEVKDIYSDQKIYILADTDKSRANSLKAQLEGELKKPLVMVVNNASEIQVDRNMMTGQTAPIIAISVNDDDSKGTDFANRVIELSKEVQNMKAFSMFYYPIFEKKVDELSQANLVYLMDRKVNMDGDFEKEILEEYKKKYCKTPSKYSVIGFDIMNDMLSRENKKGEIFKQINKVQTQLATKFEFEKTKTGTYINKGYRVVRLVPN
ncbi:amino acid ABC transporter substrate-binding protein [Chryseobacterium sp. MP_3.2]|uniref:amino acid ABC transporter substrate-binding protein n=1 Tax=Chryseobacterium sp. MP_3.2 TaxID=3071712 RepID=UPI002E015534|nr:peptidoglycan endopeptidase LytF [Chryseobacterium sp. MP_3.2]